jgi:hypothetical protein
MTKFSPSDSALEGFRLTRERPGTILAWAGVYLVGIVLLSLLMAASLGPDFVALLRKNDGQLGQDDVQAAAAMLVHVWPAFILVLIAAVFLMSVLTAGIYRTILRPQERGLAHLRIGREEFRLTTLNLVLFALGIVCLFIALTVTQVLRSTAPLLGFAGGIGMLVLSLWIGVRLCLATPHTFVTGHISLRETWGLTKGHFWKLFGMIVLAVVFYVMIWLLISMIGFAVVELAGGQPNLAAKGLAPGAMLAAFIIIFMQLILSVLQLVMVYAPFGWAYLQIHGDKPEA